MTAALVAAQATADHWGLAAKAGLTALGPLPVDTNLGLVYVTRDFVDDLPSIVTFLRETTHVPTWVGAAGHGVIGPEGEVNEGRALALMAGHVEPDSVRPFAWPDPGTADDFLADHGDWLARQRTVTALVHGDPRQPQLTDRLTELAKAGHAFLVGGLTAIGSDAAPGADGLVGDTGLSGALFGDGTVLAVGLTQGCQPIGRPHLVTETIDNVVMRLDDRSALEVLKAEAGDIIARDLKRVAGYIHVALPIEGADDARAFQVRTLLAIDPIRGWLAIGQPLTVGDRLMFVRRDANAAQRDLRAMLNGLVNRLDGRPVKGGVYVSCLGRGAHMFGRDGRESEMIHDVLGDFPLIGFSGSGEICHDHLHGFAGVLALFV
jgi:small ligand-binding sensory domain FIST